MPPTHLFRDAGRKKEKQFEEIRMIVALCFFFFYVLVYIDVILLPSKAKTSVITKKQTYQIEVCSCSSLRYGPPTESRGQQAGFGVRDRQSVHRASFSCQY